MKMRKLTKHLSKLTVGGTFKSILKSESQVLFIADRSSQPMLAPMEKGSKFSRAKIQSTKVGSKTASATAMAEPFPARGRSTKAFSWKIPCMAKGFFIGQTGGFTKATGTITRKMEKANTFGQMGRFTMGNSRTTIALALAYCTILTANGLRASGKTGRSMAQAITFTPIPLIFRSFTGMGPSK